MQNKDSFDRVFSQSTLTASAEPPRLQPEEAKPAVAQTPGPRLEPMLEPWKAVRRIACFFAIVVVLIFVMNAMITSGLRRLRTSAFGASNQIMEGKVNAEIVVSGSSSPPAGADAAAAG